MAKGYKTYATEASASRKLAALRAQYPHKLFRIMLAPDGSFRYAVGVYFERPTPEDPNAGTWALSS